MDTRIIHTRFWRDEYVLTLTVKERMLFLYLLTNEYVNLSGMYELPEPLVTAYTGLANSEIKAAKEKFQADGKFAFYHSWVRIMHVDKYQVFRGEKNDVAKQKEMALVPQELIGYQYSIDRVSQKSDTSSNQKSEISNPKSEVRESQADHFLLLWNKTHGTKYSAADPIADNLTYWLKSYTADQIAEAVEKVKTHPYWKDKMNPTTFLRRKNPRGEPVDYIGEILNRQQVTNQLRTIR